MAGILLLFIKNEKSKLDILRPTYFIQESTESSVAGNP